MSINPNDIETYAEFKQHMRNPDFQQSMNASIGILLGLLEKGIVRLRGKDAILAEWWLRYMDNEVSKLHGQCGTT